MDLSIGIVSYNCRELLANCLESIRAHSGRLAVEVIVTDNASSDGTAALVRERFPEVRLIASRENLGFAAGTNRALAAASGDVLMMLNPDTEVRPGALERLTELPARAPRGRGRGPAHRGSRRPPAAHLPHLPDPRADAGGAARPAPRLPRQPRLRGLRHDLVGARPPGPRGLAVGRVHRRAPGGLGARRAAR